MNTSSTRVELLFDLAGSPTLSDHERARALRRLRSRLDADGRLRVVAQDERSQMRNRALALRRFSELMRRALAPPPPPRRPTRPSAAAKARRVAGKRRDSQTKRLRRPPATDDQVHLRGYARMVTGAPSGTVRRSTRRAVSLTRMQPRLA